MNKLVITNFQYENYFIAWSHDALKCTVITASNSEIALEIAIHYLGANPTIRAMDIFLSPSMLKDMETLCASNIKQGYITMSKKIVEYKTRNDFIDEVLADLKPFSYIRALIKRIFNNGN